MRRGSQHAYLDEALDGDAVGWGQRLVVDLVHDEQLEQAREALVRQEQASEVTFLSQ